MSYKDIVVQFLEDNKDGMKALLTWFLNRVMEYEVQEQTGAGYYERVKTRRAHRNGYRKRTLNTKLRKPQLREFPFETRVFDRYSRVEKALENAIVESYLQGISTRRIREVISALGSGDISPASVSNMAKKLDKVVQEFLNKEIEEEVPYLFVDASYFKVRDGVRYINKALYVVGGVRRDGHREILVVKVAESEEETFWKDLFEDLKGETSK